MKSDEISSHEEFSFPDYVAEALRISSEDARWHYMDDVLPNFEYWRSKSVKIYICAMPCGTKKLITVRDNQVFISLSSFEEYCRRGGSNRHRLGQNTTHFDGLAFVPLKLQSEDVDKIRFIVNDKFHRVKLYRGSKNEALIICIGAYDKFPSFLDEAQQERMRELYWKEDHISRNSESKYDFHVQYWYSKPFAVEIFKRILQTKHRLKTQGESIFVELDKETLQSAFGGLIHAWHIDSNIHKLPTDFFEFKLIGTDLKMSKYLQNLCYASGDDLDAAIVFTAVKLEPEFFSSSYKSQQQEFNELFFKDKETNGTHQLDKGLKRRIQDFAFLCVPIRLADHSNPIVTAVSEDFIEVKRRMPYLMICALLFGFSFSLGYAIWRFKKAEFEDWIQGLIAIFGATVLGIPFTCAKLGWPDWEIAQMLRQRRRCTRTLELVKMFGKANVRRLLQENKLVRIALGLHNTGAIPDAGGGKVLMDEIPDEPLVRACGNQFFVDNQLNEYAYNRSKEIALVSDLEATRRHEVAVNFSIMSTGIAIEETRSSQALNIGYVTDNVIDSNKIIFKVRRGRYDAYT